MNTPATNDRQADRLIRLPDVLKVIPISKAAWWQGIREGKFPGPIKLGPKTACWRESDIQKLIAEGI